MCMELFVASDVPLPLIAYDPAAVFSTQAPLTGSEPVLRLFSKPYVYDLSSCRRLCVWIRAMALGTWRFSPRMMCPLR